MLSSEVLKTFDVFAKAVEKMTDANAIYLRGVMDGMLIVSAINDAEHR